MSKRNPNNTDTHKQCPHCQKILPRTDFPRNRSKPDGLYAWCKSCTYGRNSRVVKNRERARVKSRALKQHYVNLKGGKCVHCGYNEYISALDFHHTGKKTGHVSAMIAIAANSTAYDRDAILLELGNCVILCSNCHRGLHGGEWSLDEQ